MVTQAQIDALKWFHDFDFPGGLKARSADREHAVFHRIHWQVMSEWLKAVDFRDKTALDVGCWDGYFSFLAEELGARRVLAVDDYSQNWGSQECFWLARALKGSTVELLPDVSVYDLSTRVSATFDVVLFLGVYYHLHAPYAAFAELRKVCHATSVVVIEGECIQDREAAYARVPLDKPHGSIFVPTIRLLISMLRACYFEVERVYSMREMAVSDLLALADPADVLKLARRRVQAHHEAQRARPAEGGDDRVMIFARPFQGKNPYHPYKPLFGLDQFDVSGRFSDAPEPP